MQTNIRETVGNVQVSFKTHIPRHATDGLEKLPVPLENREPGDCGRISELKLRTENGN